MISYIGYNYKVGVFMKYGNSKKNILVLMLGVGALGGTLLGEILGSKFKVLDFLKQSYIIGTPRNLYFDLKIVNFTFGINIYINLMTIIGIILAIIIYKKH